jgi:hypothetical protein
MRSNLFMHAPQAKAAPDEMFQIIPEVYDQCRKSAGVALILLPSTLGLYGVRLLQPLNKRASPKAERCTAVAELQTRLADTAEGPVAKESNPFF